MDIQFVIVDTPDWDPDLGNNKVILSVIGTLPGKITIEILDYGTGPKGKPLTLVQIKEICLSKRSSF